MKHEPHPAESIAGWMTGKELRWLAEKAAGKRVIEVGSFKGRSASAIAAVAEQLWCIDLWADRYIVGQEHWHEVKQESYGDAFRTNCKAFLDSGKIVMLQGDSGKVLADFAFGPVDMIFLDGGHEEETVRRDIELALPLLKSGGLLCGHDYPINWGWPGVARAAEALLPGAKGAVDGIFEWTKP
jgi:predicted O-methyltransferase YrrM